MSESQQAVHSQQQRTSESETDDSRRSAYSENEHLLEKEGVSGIQKPRAKSGRWMWLGVMITIANLVILCLTIILFVHGRQSCNPKTSYTDAFKETQEYSPVYKSFSPSSHEISTNGTLFNYPPSVYRNDPAPEVDAEWNRISPNSWLLFTRDEIMQMGKDPATRAKASPPLLEALGFPSDADMYYGWIDAFHQTHCLNVLRMHSYWDHYYSGNYGTWDHAHELHWTHVSHCLDIVRQNLQCNANADIITHVWKEGQAGPFPDFNIPRKCNNFEGLLAWQENAMIPDDLVDKYVFRPADEDIETLYPAEPELFLSKGVKPAEGRVFDHEVERPKHFFSSW